jgi:hypothetical protein
MVYIAFSCDSDGCSCKTIIFERLETYDKIFFRYIYLVYKRQPLVFADNLNPIILQLDPQSHMKTPYVKTISFKDSTDTEFIVG